MILAVALAVGRRRSRRRPRTKLRRNLRSWRRLPRARWPSTRSTVDGKLVAVGERGPHPDLNRQRRDLAAGPGADAGHVDRRRFFFDENLGWAVGHDSAILRTWTAATPGNWSTGRPKKRPRFLTSGSRTRRTASPSAPTEHTTRPLTAASTWDFVSVEDTDWHLHKIARANDGRLFIAAEAGYVYRSDDGGETWEELPLGLRRLVLRRPPARGRQRV